MTAVPRLLGLQDDFKFRCHPGVPCFTRCCADVTIFLTPFDALRACAHLGMDSTAFLARHTLRITTNNPIIPLVVLKMDEARGRRCGLVTDQGCSIYNSRPWACRLYPLDLVGRQDFRVIVTPEVCQGLKEDFLQPVHAYLVDQGVTLSAELDALYQEITDHPKLREIRVENPRIMEMIYLAAYDLDRFRDFVFGSSFLQKFDVPKARLDLIKENQVELLRLGFDWIRLGLFAEKTLVLKEEALKKGHARK